MSTAQDEIDGLLAKNKGRHTAHHPDDHDDEHDDGHYDAQTRFSDDAPEPHPKLRDSRGHDQDSDGSGAEQDTMPTSTRGYTVPATLFSANTGPKGVIADAQSFENAKRSGWRARLRSNMTKRTSPNNQFSKELAKAPTQGTIERGDLSSDDDERFMREWRKYRLKELQTFDPRARRRSPSKRTFGRVEVVDASGYLDAVEKVGPETVVIVAIYDDESPVSRLVEDCLSTLAQKYSETRFVKLHYIEAEMDAVSVPAILAYKGGDLFANLVSVIDEIPPNRNLSSSSLELVLQQHHIFT